MADKKWKISDKFYLNSNGYCWWLSEIRVKGEKSANAGEEYEATIEKYSTSVSNLLAGISRMKLSESEGESIDDLTIAVRGLTRAVEAFSRYMEGK